MKNTEIPQRGMALIAVLWLVAAMGLIITGIVHAVRIEVQSAGLQRHALVAGALADAAILLALQSLLAQQQEPGATTQVIPVQFDGQNHLVSVQPLNGLIDINNATDVLLAAMYRHAGGLNPAAAQALAQSTVEVRQIRDSQGVPQGFDAVEDLMRVPAMTYDLYAKINNLVIADLKDGSGRINPKVAPAGVLRVLTDGDVPRATALAAGRDLDPTLMDTSFFNPNQIEMASSRSMQLQVQVGLPDGGTVQKAWRVDLGADPRSGLPWRALGARQSIQHPTPSDH